MYGKVMKEQNIHFVVPGHPVGRHLDYGRGRTFLKANSRQFQNEISAAAKKVYKGDPLAIPFWIYIVSYFKIPKSASKKKREEMIKCDILPEVKPDTDNITKNVKDALSDIIWSDDKHVVSDHCEKFYGDVPQTEVYITYYTEE